MSGLQYPMTFTKESDGSYTVEISHPNGRFQGVTEGDNLDDAMKNAQILLGEILIFSIKDDEIIPEPRECKAGTHEVVASPLIAAKVTLYMEMKKQGVKKASLARKLQCDQKQVDRIIEPRHKSTFAQMEAAFNALGKHMVIGIENRVV